MSNLIINGRKSISGEVTPVGNKNAILPLICSSVLTDQPVIFHNVPSSSSVRTLLQIFRKLGGKVAYIGKNSIRLNGSGINNHVIDKELSRKERSALMFLGPLLVRLGRAEIDEAGGCKLGNRPVDTLFQGLISMGAVMDPNNIYKYTTKGIKSNVIYQMEASVTGTESLILTSVLAKGTTIINNAACEPHVQDLCNFLNSIGANIQGVGSNKLIIHGVEKLKGGEWSVISDHIDVGGLIMVSAITGGSLKINNAIPEHMYQVINYLKKLNINVEIQGSSIFVPANQELIAKRNLKGDLDKIYDAPHPIGVPMDLIPQFVTTAALSSGTIKVHSFFYETQLLSLYEELLKMRANIQLTDTKTIMTFGPSKLKGAHINASSIISSAYAELMAALVADGTSVIKNADIISRRYPDIVPKLKSLGADIEVY